MASRFVIVSKCSRDNYFNFIMNQTPKIIEDAVEEFRIQLPKPKKHYHTQVDFRDHIYLEEWLTQTLTQIHTQAKEEERKAVIEDVREKAEKLDYFWQKEHQQRVLISLEDLLSILTKHQALNKVGRNFGNAIKKLGER